MKVLLIDVNCKYSSTGKIVYDLFQKLNAGGHTARIAYGRGEEIHEDGIYKFGIDSETYLHALLARITGMNGYYSPRSTRRLIKYIEDFDPDIIHIHELHAYFVNTVELLEFLKQRGTPVIWTFHCEYMYTGKCGVTLGCEKYKTGCGDCPYKHEYVGSWFLDRTKQMLEDKKAAMAGLNLRSIVSPSAWLAAKIKDTYLGEVDIRVIHNGIDTVNTFYPRDNASDLRKQYDIPVDAPLILAVAPDVLDERKGGKILLDLADKIRKDGGKEYFVCIGADRTEKLTDNVVLIERTKNQKELAEWYSAADLFIICSRAETFPTTCMEALACGTPIVGLNNGGIPETAPEPYGLFVDDMVDEGSGAYTSMLRNLADGINTQLTRNPSSDEITRYARIHYDRDVMCKQYMELYQIEWL